MATVNYNAVYRKKSK